METETLFQAANMVALAGWVILIASPFIPKLADRVAGILIPGLLAVAYTALILAFWTRAEGGFGSLAEVSLLFQTPELLLAGWIHYLAYDLFVGAWIVRRARSEGVPFLIVLPILPLAFLFGPIGYLAWLGVTAIRRSLSDKPATA